MRLLTGLVTFVLACSAVPALAQAERSGPTILIAQYRTFNGDQETTLHVADDVAKELDALGQVSPMVWSMTDFKFRKVAIDKNFADFDQYANPNEAQHVAKLVGAEYLMEVSAQKVLNGSNPIVRLYRTGNNKPIWEFGTVEGRKYTPGVKIDGRLDSGKSKEFDEEMVKNGNGLTTMVVTVDGQPDWFSLSATLARTWARMLSTTAFKDLPIIPRLDPVTDSNGYTLSAKGVDIQSGDVAQTIQSADQYLADKKTALAVVVLRDGIDKNPLEPSLRTKLADILIDLDLFDSAAREAERGARLAQAKPELWLLAAKAWILDQKPDKAQECLNEALARGSKSTEAQRLAGDVHLLLDDPQRAIDSYTKALAAGPDPQSSMGRAIAYAMAGMEDECTADLKSLEGLDPTKFETAYLQAVRLSDERFDQVANQLKSLVPDIKLKHATPENQAKAARLHKSSAAMAELIAKIPVPPSYVDSNKARNLAHKLLNQAASEVFEFAKSGTGDMGDESLISLGEAVKLMVALRENFRIERQEDHSNPSLH